MSGTIRGSALIHLIDVLSKKLVYTTTKELNKIPTELPEEHVRILNDLEINPIVVIATDIWLVKGKKSDVDSDREYFTIKLESGSTKYDYICK